MKRLIITIGATFLIACTILLEQTNWMPEAEVDGDVMMASSGQYDKGANDALQAITLLSLELCLNNERKTWGEMCEIVRKRLHVTQPEATRSYNE